MFCRRKTARTELPGESAFDLRRTANAKPVNRNKILFCEKLRVVPRGEVCYNNFRSDIEISIEMKDAEFNL